MPDLDQLIKDYDIKILSDYIPMDGQEEPRLKWKVRLYRLNESVMELEYTAGMAHAPSYPAACAVDECRTGLRAGSTDFKKHYILPVASDVIRSVMLDSSAMDYGCFEDWARNYGYDTDSRAAEAIYRLCLQRAVRLRANLGKEKFDALQLAALTED
jgi:hypothetical protein